MSLTSPSLTEVHHDIVRHKCKTHRQKFYYKNFFYQKNKFYRTESILSSVAAPTN
jgi:hypothetical protein